jgi:hypothetical protein
MAIAKEEGCCRAEVRVVALSNWTFLTADREMQLFLLGFIVISICEILTIGGFPLDPSVRKVRGQCFLMMVTVLIVL